MNRSDTHGLSISWDFVNNPNYTNLIQYTTVKLELDGSQIEEKSTTNKETNVKITGLDVFTKYDIFITVHLDVCGDSLENNGTGISTQGSKFFFSF